MLTFVLFLIDQENGQCRSTFNWNKSNLSNKTNTNLTFNVQFSVSFKQSYQNTCNIHVSNSSLGVFLFKLSTALTAYPFNYLLQWQCIHPSVDPSHFQLYSWFIVYPGYEYSRNTDRSTENIISFKLQLQKWMKTQIQNMYTIKIKCIIIWACTICLQLRALSLCTFGV